MRRWITWLALIIGAAALVVWWASARREPASDPVITLTRESALGAPLASEGCLAISPDGSHLAFVTSVEGRRMLAIARLDEGTAAKDGLASMAVSGTEDARHPAWSPDGTRVAFATYERGPLKVLDVRTHAIATLVPSIDGAVAWGAGGALLFTGIDHALHRVDASGRVTRVTTIDPAENGSEHAWPAFLPDGTRFIYLSRAARPSDSRVYLSSLDAPYERRVVAEAHSAALYADGHLLFVYEGILMAQPLDAETGRITGVALPLAVGLHWNEWSGEPAVTANGAGDLAFRLERHPPDQLAWFNIGSMRTEVIPGITNPHEVRRSPTGSHIAVTIRDPRTGMDDIWIAAAGGGEPQRLTAHAASDNSPVWTPDGRAIVFRSNRTGVYNLYRAEIGQPGDRLLLTANVDDQPTDVSRNGDILLFNRWSMDTREDIWALPLAGGPPYPMLRTEFLEGHAAFSPDGRWIAYETNGSGATQVHVRRVPVDGASLQISVNGGYKPRWTDDGRTIVYVRDDNRFEAADLDLGRDPVTPAPPRALFITRPRLADLGGYDLDPAGRRILAPTPGATGTPEPSITRIRGWRRFIDRP